LAIRPVLRLPSHELKLVAEPVERIDRRAEELATNLVDTMRAHQHCVGLAAPQIGVGLRAFAMDVGDHPKARSRNALVILFDPELLADEMPRLGREGCMSVPDLTGNVARGSRVVVRGIAPDGGVRVIEADAVEARALLHEIDHLDGLLFLDRVASPHADVFPRKRYR
jgi:peptide deformylase